MNESDIPDREYLEEDFQDTQETDYRNSDHSDYSYDLTVDHGLPALLPPQDDPAQ